MPENNEPKTDEELPDVPSTSAQPEDGLASLSEALGGSSSGGTEESGDTQPEEGADQAPEPGTAEADVEEPNENETEPQTPEPEPEPEAAEEAESETPSLVGRVAVFALPSKPDTILHGIIESESPMLVKTPPSPPFDMIGGRYEVAPEQMIDILPEGDLFPMEVALVKRGAKDYSSKPYYDTGEQTSLRPTRLTFGDSMILNVPRPANPAVDEPPQRDGDITFVIEHPFGTRVELTLHDVVEDDVCDLLESGRLGLSLTNPVIIRSADRPEARAFSDPSWTDSCITFSGRWSTKLYE